MFRFLLILTLLVAQVWPAAALARGDGFDLSEACPPASCCEIQAEASSPHCCCMTRPELPAPGNPAVPAPSAPAGRDLIAQPVWVELVQSILFQLPHEMQTPAPAAAWADALPRPSARRLPVLFCSILI